MLAECHHCGAPLDIKGSERYAKCKYCDYTNLVRRMKTVAKMTPSEWQPPPVWTPPAQFKAVSVELRYHEVKVSPADAARASRVGCTITFAILLLTGGIIAFAIWASLPPGVDPDEPPQFGSRVLAPGGGTITFNGIAAGTIYGSDLGAGCSGYFTEAPQLVVDLRSPGVLRVDVVGTTGGDSVVAVRSPDGTTRCDDDSGGNRNARVSGAVPAGIYRIWAGMLSESDRLPYTLTVTHGPVSAMPDNRGVIVAGPPSRGVVDLATMPLGGRVDGTTSQDVQVNSWGSGCLGQIPAVPHVHVNATRPTPVTITARSTADTTLVVQDATGRLHCNDDSEGRDPRIEVTLPPGRTAVWVGLLSGGTDAAFQLEVAAESYGDSPPDANGLYPTAPPMLGTLDLSTRGALPARYQGETRMGVSSDALAQPCHGNIPRVPHLTIHADRARDVRLAVSSRSDLMMAVRDPSGVFRCDDDSGGSQNPRLDLSLAPGATQVWVGTYNAGPAQGFTLRVQAR